MSAQFRCEKTDATFTAGNVGSTSHNRPISPSMNPSRCMPVSSLIWIG